MTKPVVSDEQEYDVVYQVLTSVRASSPEAAADLVRRQTMPMVLTEPEIVSVTRVTDPCPRCGKQLTYDEVDIGVGTLRGNPGCESCHWTPEPLPDF